LDVYYVPISVIRMKILPYISLFVLAPLLAAPQPDTLNHDYVGTAACAVCHKEIAETQSHTSMARTWRGVSPVGLPLEFDEQKTEGLVRYDLSRSGNHFQWRIELPGHFSREAPVEAVVGGRRQGLSFLARITDIDGVGLERSPLVEVRLIYGAQGLVMAPGFSPLRAVSNYEAVLGRVLGPQFEQKCLTCHGIPRDENGDGGVRCESCHGPGRAHVIAIGRGDPNPAIVNPDKLTPDESLDLCGRCHSGLQKLTAPVPDELLISNEVVALRNTECFKQSRKGLTCTTCHNPHHDAKANDVTYNRACRNCHGFGSTNHAEICPVNQREGCIGCHMPNERVNGFPMTDHWIRVHPELIAPSHSWPPSLHTHVIPISEFLSVISVADRAAASQVLRQLRSGAPFFELAAKYSNDSSASNGGYIGEVQLTDLDPVLAAGARRLRYGEISPVLSTSGKFIILFRMPVDFRYRAVQLEGEADVLSMKGDLRGALEKYQAAVRIYPAFLRALILMAQVEQQLGNTHRAFELLAYAGKLYPSDATAQFNLGVACGMEGASEEGIAAYRRAIDLEPEFTPAYLNLGLLLLSINRIAKAATVLRTGLHIDPISAPLYYGLALAEQKQGHALEAGHAMALAVKIDPEYVKQQAESLLTRGVDLLAAEAPVYPETAVKAVHTGF
jgi:tetratricopeptide (TPR) repeat protein